MAIYNKKDYYLVPILTLARLLKKLSISYNYWEYLASVIDKIANFFQD